ncbi:CGNR zinc finger domain-containing protein [Gordonia soli]|uniref:CGNR zinc finger domain-containing protein n=1 Tax=Gordonia soli TaxID=320799 RepID=UPI001FE20B87|nr:CGNR zinc finger domain-containing protein [Gordonia soli]
MLNRPLTGEPLPLDLANTQWVISGEPHDALTDPDFVRSWMADHGRPDVADLHRATRALVSARAAIRTVLPRPTEASAYDAFNSLLARGHLRERVDADGVSTVVEVDDPDEWLAWKAAHDLIVLLNDRPHRIKPCGGCVLWFFDNTRSGTRRWCSMEACGNRAKVRRHRALHD